MACLTIAPAQDIDTTNPEAAQWYWNTIRDNILSQGFDSIWADETEPDLPPDGAYFHVGPGTQFFNVYPLFHVGALYDGYRRDEPGKKGADPFCAMRIWARQE